MTDAPQANEGAAVRFPPPLVFIGFLLLGLVADRLLLLPHSELPMVFRIALAPLPIAFGVALIAGAIGGFRRAETPPEPWREVTAIVTTGVYRFTRNPMYAGMALMHLGLAIALDSAGGLAGLALALIAIRTQVIAREEAYMKAKFGISYIDYCKRVRRWL